MEVNPPMYLWPDDWCAYGSPLDGYFWQPSPDRPSLYVATRRLERNERQVLPGGVVMEWRPPVEKTEKSALDTYPLAERPTALYRCYNESEELIYVGIAVDPQRRWKHHASLTPWWPEVQRRSIEWHDDRRSALNAEAAAIVTESPVYNIAGKPRS